MADSASESAAPTPGKSHQRTPPQGQKRRGRKNNNSNNAGPSDGTVSDGALMSSAQTPQSTAQRQRQSMAVPISIQQEHGGRKASAPKARHISTGGALQPNTPGREQAYAGPTFQASPAASALPVPKFFSRSVPNATGQPSLQGRLAGEKTPEANSSPESDAVSPVPPSRQMHQSPLDLFFKADRAEKEKSRSSSETLSPAAAARLPEPATVPRNSNAQHQGRNIFLQELDGDDVPSPRTNTSPRPQIGERARSSPGVPQYVDDDKQVYTKNLKDLLFNTAASAASPVANSSPRSMYNNPPSPITGAHSPVSNFHSPSPFHNGYGTGNATFNGYNPSTPPSQPRYNTNQARENSSATGNYHYGNRNLSPLFKAAARETPPRPSSLRQEIGSPGHSYGNDSHNQNRGVAGEVNTGWNGNAHGGGNASGHTNGNDAARHFLDQQVRASTPAELPEFGFRPQQGGAGGVNGQSGGVEANGGASGQPQDLRVMEDDLRRILKLNVLG